MAVSNQMKRVTKLSLIDPPPPTEVARKKYGDSKQNAPRLAFIPVSALCTENWHLNQRCEATIRFIDDAKFAAVGHNDVARD